MALTQEKRRQTPRARDPVQRLDREIKFLDDQERSREARARLLKQMRKDFRRFFPNKKNPFEGVK